jgi:hypothetical protein
VRRAGAPLYCRPGNPEARRSAHSCDVQEQHTSGVQPELAEHELRHSGGTGLFRRGIRGKTGHLCGALQYYAPGQERVKGNELGGGIPWVRPPDEYVEAVNLVSQ